MSATPQEIQLKPSRPCKSCHGRGLVGRYVTGPKDTDRSGPIVCSCVGRPGKVSESGREGRKRKAYLEKKRQAKRKMRAAAKVAKERVMARSVR